MEERKHIVILAAGDFPVGKIPLSVLCNADFVVCCDSAYLQFSVFNIHHSQPFIVVGDGDSLPEKQRQEIGEKFVYISEQDDNDLTKSVRWAVSRFGIEDSNYTILGATGKREDHTLGNISLLATYIEMFPGIEMEMLTEYGRFTVASVRRTYDSFPRQQVSLFSMTPDVPVSTEGLQWPIKKRCIPRWWEGTLNSSLTDRFTVVGGKIIVFQTYEPKEV